MTLSIPLNSAPLISIEAYSKTVSIKLAGAALGYSLYEKLAQIANMRFPTAMATAHLPYVGLISGFFADSQLLAIYALALLILIPVQRYQTAKKTALRMPAFMQDMRESRTNFHYFPLTREMDLIGCILNKCGKHSILISGSSGSGKTSLVESIVQMQLNKDPSLHPGFVEKRFYRVSCIDIMNNTKFRGLLEKNIKEILEFAASDKNIVLVCDEIHQLTLANNYGEGGMSILESFKEELARGKIAVIGMTTTREFERFIKPDAALNRRFTKIHLEDPTFGQSLNMLKERGKFFRDNYPGIECPDAIYDYILGLIKPSDNTSLIDQAFDLLDTTYSKVSYTSEKVITQKIIDEISTCDTEPKNNNQLDRYSYIS